MSEPENEDVQGERQPQEEPASEQPERRPRDLGREFSARQPGTTSKRLGAEEEAMSAFAAASVRAEHAAGRDMFIFSAASDSAEQVRLAEIQRTDLVEVGHTFVAPEGLAAAVETLKGHRVLFLSGDVGRGRLTAATYLLRECSRVYMVHRATKLAALTGEVVEQNAGYVLADPPSSMLRELGAYDLQALTPVLEKREARLIVTVTPGRRFAEPEIAGLVHELGEVKDRQQIFDRRLECRLEPEDADRILDDLPLMKLITEQLRDEPSPGHTALLVDVLVEARKAGEPLLDTVRDRLATRDEERFQQWAEGLPDLPTQCMALAVAVLGGEPYETVAAAAARLQRMLEPANPRESGERERADPLMARKSTRLRTLRARVLRSTVRTSHGDEPTETVRYRDDTLPERYLLYFWNEYDEARPGLLNWLRMCAEHELESVRVRAAVATGVLAARAFDHVRATIIERWARDTDDLLRDAVAITLRGAAGRDPELAAPIRGMVGVWAGSDSPELRAAAARSWRIEYDAAGPAAAFEALKRLGDDDDEDVTTAVCLSVTEMWQHAGESLEAPAALLGWLHEAGHKKTARLAFLLAAADLVREEADVTWPALLHISTLDQRRQREIGTLWRDAVTTPWLHRYAKEVLAEWARTADDKPLVRSSFARLMDAVGSDRRARAIIVHEAGKWARGARSARQSSAAVLRMLDGERS